VVCPPVDAAGVAISPCGAVQSIVVEKHCSSVSALPLVRIELLRRCAQLRDARKVGVRTDGRSCSAQLALAPLNCLDKLTEELAF
jgi:hypothetical protein